MCLEEAAQPIYRIGDFRRTGAAALGEPVGKAPPGGVIGRTFWPGDDFEASREFAGGSDQGKALGNAAHLPVSAGRHGLANERSTHSIHGSPHPPEVFGDSRNKGTASCSIKPRGIVLDPLREHRRVLLAMKFLEEPEARAGIGAHIDHPHRHAGGDPLPALGYLVGETDLAR